MHNPDDFVYVNQDGTARELSNSEREYLSQDFQPGDGARPYIKASHKSQDGWGSISGFLSRKSLPHQISVSPVNPNYVPREVDGRDQAIEDSRRVGDIITVNPDGSVTCAPNPNISHQKRFELFREIQLTRQRELENLARYIREEP